MKALAAVRQLPQNMASIRLSVATHRDFRPRLRLSVALVCCLLVCGGCGDLLLSSDLDSSLTVHRQFVEDASGTITLDQMLQLPLQDAVNSSSVVSWGFTKSVIWGRFDLSSSRRTQAIVEIPSTRLDRVDWFEVRGGSLVRTVETGLNAGAGTAPKHYPAITLDISPVSPVTVVCRIQSGGSLTIPLEIASVGGYTTTDQQRRYISHAQVGGLGVVVLILLLLAMLFRDWSFCLLSMCCACVLLYGLLFDNVLSLPGWSLPVWWIRAGSSLTSICAGVCLLNFSAVYCGVSALTKTDRIIYLAASVLALLYCAAHFLLPFPPINRNLSVVQTLIVISALWITSSRWRRQRRREDLLLFVTLIFCHTPAVLLMLQLNGWIPMGLTPSSLRFMAMPVIFCSLFVVLVQRRQAIELLRLNTALAQGGEAEARLLALRYQLNPHMLMNSLAAISWLSSESPQKIPRFIDNLSAILQSRLRPTSGQAWTVSTEIQLAVNLLELAEVRFGDRIQHTVVASPEASRCLLPEMLVQPLVENAIKYCPLDLPSAKIRVVAEIQQNRLLITVENSIKPGTTGTAAEGLKIGHVNIRQRLEICYGNRAQFHFHTSDALATAALELPVQSLDTHS